MGAGNKKKTLSLKEKSQPSWNCSAPARNLRKSDLGAVIFGCKHNTIGECYSELLFGLPAPHFAYVKNISPGLPLFLLNYSDRKLYGIFEAAGSGQMNIDPYGWTSDGSDYSPYPAQVRVQIRMNCHPLLEDQFKPVISGNYYEKRLFWFELDRAQTKNLISLFSLSPVDASSSLPQNTARQNTLLNYLPTSDRRQLLDHAGAPVSQSGYSHSNHCDLDVKAKESREKELVQTKSTLSSTTTSNSQQPKKWSALFKSPMTSDTSKEAGDLKVQASGSNSSHSYQGNMEWDSLQVTPCLEDESQGFVAHPEDSAMGSYEEVQAGSESNWELGYHSDQQRTSFEALTIVDTSQESEHFKAVESNENMESNENLPCSDETNMGWGSSRGTSPLEGESRPSEASMDDIIKTSEGEVVCLETTCKQSYSFADNHENATVPTSVMDEEHSEDGYSSGALTVSEMKSSDINSVVAELVQEIKGLKAFQLEQDQKISSLEQELVKSKVEIQQLKNHFHLLESRPLSSVGHFQDAVINSCDEPCSKINDSILILGGFDGSSWLSALASYSPSQDTMKALKSMTSVCSYASAATLNGELFVFGGVHGDLRHDTVESYNPTSNKWFTRPPLNHKRGNLAGASLYGKIFALGGGNVGNGVECFSDVEMLDMNIGRWITTESMLQKRFAPAAAEINGTLYVVGGYDGKNYLNSVERFDPREHSWMRLGCMNTRRGCHSLTVLNEKLYAMGGFNGAQMDSTVEIFDPRLGSWMMGEPMNNARGYSGAVVLGEKIYVIGGVIGVEKGSDGILGTIECYKEGRGWEVTNLKAVGKRCFFSAVVL